MKQVTRKGKTVDEAVEQALRDLNTSADKVEVEVIESPKKGLFGLVGARPALVRVSKRENPVDDVTRFLLEVTKAMGLSVTVKVSRKGEHLLAVLNGEDIAVLIGKRGHTLNALQYLTNVVVNKGLSQQVKIVLDAENYREKRQKTLERLAVKMADRVRRTGQKVALDPMPAMERKVVHLTVKEIEGVTTHSEGDGSERHVVLLPFDQQK